MWLKPEQLSDVLNRNILSRLDGEQYETKPVSAHTLLSPDRFDLLAKYIYVKFKLQNIQSGFGAEIYAAHINAFNGFVENDESGKVGKENFIANFDEVIGSLKSKGFSKNSYLPVSSEGDILDGAHRLSAALYLDLDVNIVETRLEPQRYDYAFFENRGLGRVYLDAMASEYAKLKDNVYMVLVWPSAEGKDKELGVILDKYGHVVYRKSIFLNANGAVQLVRQAYMSEPWVGTQKDNFIGARNKAQWCFDKKGPVRAILFESTKDLIQMKEEIRDLYGINKHAIHINDTKQETLELAGLLFNENSINWLNNAVLRSFGWYSRLFQHYKSWLQKEHFEADNFCIDGSASMSAYGLREARDIDFLTFSDEAVETGFKEIGCHNDELKHHPISRDEIIFNPANHFVLDAHKFISLDNIKKMKAKRDEPKDRVDVQMIEAISQGRKFRIPFRERLKIWGQPSFWKGKIKFVLLKVRYFITKLKNNLNA